MFTRFRKRFIFMVISGLAIGLFAAGAVSASTTALWTQIYPDGPTPSVRYHPNGAYDINSDRLIMFAGLTIFPANSNDNDLWILKNALGRDGEPEWVNLISSYQPGSPTPRHWYGATYDPNSNRLIIFGGCGGGCYPTLNDTWVLTNANGTEATPTQWIRLYPSGSIPAGRAAPRLSYDPVNNRVIMFSGQNGSGYGGAVYNDVWVLTNANGLGGTPQWTQIVYSMPLIGQYLATTTYDQANNRLIIFGGDNQYGQHTNGVWILKNANGLGGTPALVNLIPDGAPGSPPKQVDAVAGYDPIRNQLLLFSADGTTWLLLNANGLEDAPVWTQLASPGSTPVARVGSMCGFDPLRQWFVIWGGNTSVPSLLSDAWWLTLNQPPVADAGGPYSVNWGAELMLDGSGSTDADNNIAAYEWDLDNDGEYDDATGITAVTAFTQVGEHLIGLRVTDEGGLTDTDTAAVTVIDPTPPVITPTISGTLGSNDWYVSAVTVDWTVSDAESGIASAEGCDSAVLSSDTAGVTLTCSATNGAGLTNLVSVPSKIDQTAPAITWVGGINAGDEFYFGDVPPEPTCTAVDDLSGVDGACTVSGYEITVGVHILTATAKDYAGNQATETRSYTVLAWTLSGFYPPIDMNGVLNVAKSGSTIPLKFEIFVGGTELTDIASIKSITSALITCDTKLPSGEEALLPTGGTVLRYALDEGQFIFNWATPTTPATCYRVTLTALDGSSLVAYFKLQ
jgi:hypothetical protein